MRENRGKRGEGGQRKEEGAKAQEGFKCVSLLLFMLCVKELKGQEGCANASAFVMCVSSHYMQLQLCLHLHVHSHISTHPTEI